MWMSEAWSWIAWLTSRLTKRTIGRVVVGQSSTPAAETSLGLRLLLEVVDRSLSSSSARMYRSIAAARSARSATTGATAHPGGGADVVDREHVAGVGHGEDESAVLEADRGARCGAADGAADRGDGGAVDGVVDQLDERDAGLRRARLGQLRRA